MSQGRPRPPSVTAAQSPAICLVLAPDAPLPPIDLDGLARGDVLLVQSRRARVPGAEQGGERRIGPLLQAVCAHGVRELVVCHTRGAPAPAWAPAEPVSDEDHVLEQARNALGWWFVREAVARGELRVHAWLHDPERHVVETWDPARGAFRDLEEGGPVAVDEEPPHAVAV